MLSALIMALALLPGPPAAGPDVSILIVTAHPDDEAMFAATVWKAAREHGASVDLALITDGVGGYRFSTLAEPIYGLELTDPDVAKTSLAAIRKRELMAGGEIVGIRNFFFLDQPDEGKILDVDSVFAELWDGAWVQDRLTKIIEKGQYDMVLTFLPVPSTHAHHKGAALLALAAVNSLPENDRPVIVGSQLGNELGDTDFRGLDGYPLSAVAPQEPVYLDRDQPIGLDGRLNYQIVVNWLISEHKSQGTMQTYLNAGRYERFWIYALNNTSAAATGRDLLTSFGLDTR